MIQSKEFLGTIQHISEFPFNSREARLIAKWCMSYYKKHQDAPKKDIQTKFNQWCEKTKDEDLKDIVSTVLETIQKEDNEHPNINLSFLIEQTSERFNFLALRDLSDNLESALTTNDVKRSIELLHDFKEIQIVKDGIRNVQPTLEDFIPDKGANEDMITFKGKLGEFFENTLVRKALIGIQAPAKRGKSFWLLEFAYKALMQGRTVAYFDAGDMSKDQIRARLVSRITKIPMNGKKGCTVRIPTDINIVKSKQGKILPRISSKELPIKYILSREEKHEAYYNFMLDYADSHKRFMLSSHPTSSLSVDNIRSWLVSWESQKTPFVPDVILIDYADILDMPGVSRDRRDLVNDTWKKLMRMAQETNSLVVIATQANAASYKQQTQDMSNFSEDNRKNAHVSGMFALNQTPEEKKEGIMRLNWTALRLKDYSSDDCLYCAGNLSIACPCIISM
jgi:hypothetical protein